MQSPTLLLNAVFDNGNIVGPILAWVFVLLMVIEFVYVWVKYVITSDK